MISEDSSKKRGRGRPRVIDEVSRALYEGLGVFSNISTGRGRQDVYYRQRACLALHITDPVASEPFRWLADIDLMRGGEGKGWRPSILTELGRIDDEDQLRAVALEVCERKPGTREAIALIRRWRLGREGKGGAADLEDELVGRVNDYLRRYPGTDWAVVLDALSKVYIRVRDQSSDSSSAPPSS
jgi:hypothetical protein